MREIITIVIVLCVSALFFSGCTLNNFIPARESKKGVSTPYFSDNYLKLNQSFSSAKLLLYEYQYLHHGVSQFYYILSSGRLFRINTRYENCFLKSKNVSDESFKALLSVVENSQIIKEFEAQNRRKYGNRTDGAAGKWKIYSPDEFNGVGTIVNRIDKEINISLANFDKKNITLEGKGCEKIHRRLDSLK